MTLTFRPPYVSTIVQSLEFVCLYSERMAHFLTLTFDLKSFPSVTRDMFSSINFRLSRVFVPELCACVAIQDRRMDTVQSIMQLPE